MDEIEKGCIIGFMPNETAKSKPAWNFWLPIVSLFIAIFVQSLFFTGFNDPNAEMRVTAVIDILILLCLVISRLRKTKGRIWILYALLPYLIIPVIKVIFYFIDSQ
jgi:hypothetical protein